MNPINNYIKWEEIVCNEFSIPPDKLHSARSPYICEARKLFWELCIKDGIDIYKVGEKLGKHRTTAIHILKNRVKTNRNIKEKLWNIVKHN